MIQVKNLVKNYNEIKAVQSIDFTINDGDRVAQGVVCPILNKDWSLMSKVDTLGSSDNESKTR